MINSTIRVRLVLVSCFLLFPVTTEGAGAIHEPVLGWTRQERQADKQTSSIESVAANQLLVNC